jgi:hypothetical protein
MGPLVIAGAFALVLLCAPFLLVVANRSGRLARWDEQERKRLARPWREVAPPRWLQWASLILLASYLPVEAIIWQRRRRVPPARTRGTREPGRLSGCALLAGYSRGPER